MDSPERKKVDRSILFMDMPDMKPVTKETRKANTRRKFTGGIRIANGWYRTDEEDREFRDRIRALKLP